MSLDRSTFKFGALPSPSERVKRALKVGDYLVKEELPPIPNDNSWSHGINWQMFANDKYGDCTVAGAGNKIILDTSIKGKRYTPTDKQIINTYFDLSGGVDSGLPLETVLRHWRTEGIAGHKIGAYARVDIRNSFQVRAAMYLFGGLYSGMLIPDFAMVQGVWDNNLPEKEIVGGHCVILTDYHRWGKMCATWGMDQPMTSRFFTKYFFEIWAVISEDWLGGGKCPHGFKRDELLKDLTDLTS
jgi:hypothetical protein